MALIVGVGVAKTQALLYGWNGSEWVPATYDLATETTLSSIKNNVSSINTKLANYSAQYDLGTFTATGAGDAIDTTSGFMNWTWTVVSDASSSNVTVKFQGSIDNTNWFDLDEYRGTGNTMRHVVNKPVRYIRAYVSSMGDASSIEVKCVGIR